MGIVRSVWYCTMPIPGGYFNFFLDKKVAKNQGLGVSAKKHSSRLKSGELAALKQPGFLYAVPNAFLYAEKPDADTKRLRRLLAEPLRLRTSVFLLHNHFLHSRSKLHDVEACR